MCPPKAWPLVRNHPQALLRAPEVSSCKLCACSASTNRYFTKKNSIDIQVPPNILLRWLQQHVQLREIAKVERKSLSLCAGPVGQLEAVQGQLHTWLFKKCKEGMAISIAHVVWKAQKFIGPEFTDKSFNAKFMVTKRWLKKFAYLPQQPRSQG